MWPIDNVKLVLDHHPLNLVILIPLDFTIYSSPVAQSVEQVTVNHWVGGSSPSRGATFDFV